MGGWGGALGDAARLAGALGQRGWLPLWAAERLAHPGAVGVGLVAQDRTADSAARLGEGWEAGLLQRRGRGEDVRGPGRGLLRRRERRVSVLAAAMSPSAALESPTRGIERAPA